MVNKNLIKNCKICGKQGLQFFEKKYSLNEFNEFFENFYGPKHIDILKQYLKDDYFSILKCFDCNFIWQKFIPDEHFSNTLYEEVINKEQSLKKSKKLASLLLKRYQFNFNTIYNYLKKTKINVLDFGAGWGTWLTSLDNEKVNRFAFEISPSRKSHLNHLGIKVLNDLSIKNYDNYFDYIRLEQVLEHIPDLDTCMVLIKKLSKKNTILEVGVPDGKKLIKDSKFISITKGPIQPLEHLNCFSNQSLKKFMMKYNFEPINFSDILSLYFNKSLFTLTGVKILISEVLNNFFSTTIKFKNKI